MDLGHLSGLLLNLSQPKKLPNYLSKDINLLFTQTFISLSSFFD